MQQGAGASKLRVFVSYSRSDQDFADELVAGLQAARFEPYLDRHDIAAGEKWEVRLEKLIESADTVVFIISPKSIASKRCDWEVGRALELKKRLLPIVWRTVEDGEINASLKQLNYIYFTQEHSFGPSLLTLATALNTDILWVREHTRIGEAASRWKGSGRAEALLLRGTDLAAAKEWLKSQPRFAPEPSLLHRDFILESETSEVAHASAEHQRLEQIASAQKDREQALSLAAAALQKGQQALAAATALLLLICVGAFAWYNQALIREGYVWVSQMRPYMIANYQSFVLSAELERALKSGQGFRECYKDCPEMVVVPAGSFLMGSPVHEQGRTSNEGPQQLITFLRPFAVAKYSIKFSEWDACVKVGGCRKVMPTTGDEFESKPVVAINWDEAKQYAAWLSLMTGKRYRLLTEAEWEYSARGGTSTAYWWGNEVGRGNANCEGCESGWDGHGPSPVGAFRSNGFGLYDMNGNVWQWVEDCHEDTLVWINSTGVARIRNDCERHVARGGSYYLTPEKIRSAYRYWASAGNRSATLGFRVAREIDAEGSGGSD